ncbi:MAG: hypothetical protein GEV07_03450 [Streptosporangiales bacterium]|nr:hypothetical protein [Streptosporangiales bacterium]
MTVLPADRRRASGSAGAWRALLSPRRVAIVGLSSAEEKHGARVLRHLRASGFRGDVSGVNPRGVAVDGVPVVPTLAALPGVPDVLVCAIPAAGVCQVVADAGALGVPAVIVFSGGFAEAGAAGRQAQDELARVARASGVRVLGPNSGGVVHPEGRCALSFLTCLDRPPHEVRTGPVGVVTQSGGTGSYLHNLAAERGSGLAASISTGNEADLTVADGIVALADQPAVRVVAVVLETVREGRAFVDAVRYAHAGGKPVVACRLGTSETGQRLARGHTGALASASRVVDGVCDALGIVRTSTPGELLDVAELMAYSRVPTGDRVGVVTHSGGTAILLADLLTGEGLRLLPPPQELAIDVAAFVEHGSPTNPLDLGAIVGGPHRFAEVVRGFAGSGAYDVVLAVSTPHPPAHSVARAEQLIRLRNGAGPPVLQLWLAGDLGAPALRLLRQHAMPVTEEPRAAARALAGLLRFAAAGRETEPVPDPPGAPIDGGSLTEHRVKDLLREWQLPVVTGALALDADEARTVAAGIGLPVVVKVSSPDVLHKADAGGVRVDLRTVDEVGRAHDDVRRAVPGARVDGVLVEQHRPGLEVIVGCLVDDAFGPVVMVGLGGVDAEAVADVAFAPAPLSDVRAHRLLRGFPALANSRRVPPPDVDALARLVALLSRKFVAHPELVELEVNPLTWSEHGWLVVDALARKKTE